MQVPIAILDTEVLQCLNHAFSIKHLYKDCALMKQFLSSGSKKVEHRKEPKLVVDDDEGKNSGFPMPDGCLKIFEGSVAYDSKRRQKLACREVYTAKPTTPSSLRWSESAITFDRTNHPDSVP